MVRKFIQAVLPAVIKPLHSLWNQMIGFVYLVIAAIALRPTYVRYRKVSGGEGDISDLAAMICGAVFVLAGVGFGLHGFLRARKISRS